MVWTAPASPFKAAQQTVYSFFIDGYKKETRLCAAMSHPLLVWSLAPARHAACILEKARTEVLFGSAWEA